MANRSTTATVLLPILVSVVFLPLVYTAANMAWRTVQSEFYVFQSKHASGMHRYELARKAWQLNPDIYAYRAYFAEVQRQMGRLEAALSTLQQATVLSPTSPFVWDEIARLEFALHYPPEVIVKDLRRSLRFSGTIDAFEISRAKLAIFGWERFQKPAYGDLATRFLKAGMALRWWQVQAYAALLGKESVICERSWIDADTREWCRRMQDLRDTCSGVLQHTRRVRKFCAKQKLLWRKLVQ